MNNKSSLLVRRLSRLVSAGVFTAALLCGVGSAHAISDPASGNWSFTLYSDSDCAGSWFQQTASVAQTLSVSDLRSWSFNDVASSWSLCNNTGQPAKVTVTLYKNVSYGGTVSTDASNATVPAGMCLTQNSLTLNDAVSSFKVTATLE